jgi:hypothetical protein
MSELDEEALKVNWEYCLVVLAIVPTTPEDAEMTVGFDESVTVPLEIETVPVTMYGPVVNT